MTDVSDAATGTPRMPRNQRRKQLLESARQVFVSKGYHASAMDDIAEVAGVSKPVLYQHFPGKLELYLALLDLAIETMITRVSEALSSTQDNTMRVERTFRAFYDFVSSDEGDFRLIFESDLANEPLVQERIDKVTTDSAALIAEVIRDDTGLPQEQAFLLAVALVGQGQVSARWWLRNKQAIPLEQAAELVSTLGWRGIAGYPITGGN